MLLDCALLGIDGTPHIGHKIMAQKPYFHIFGHKIMAQKPYFYIFDFLCER